MLLSLIILVFSCSVVYSSESYVVKNIIFDGLHRIPIDTVTSSISLRIGDKITDDKIASVVHSLLSTGFFNNVKVFRNYECDAIIVKVEESPLLSNIIFSGNKLIKDEILYKNIQEYGIFVGELLNKVAISNFEKELEKLYHNIGKYNFFIKTEIHLLPNHCVELKFIFNEGKTAKIKQINIIGNKQFTVDELLCELRLYQNTLWFKCFIDRGFCVQKLFDSLIVLQNFYLNRGYVRFNIDSTNISMTPDKEGVYITIYITEGEKYLVSDIYFCGEMIDDYCSEIKKSSLIQVNELYNFNTIRETENNIRYFLNKYGYSDPNISTNIEINDFNRTVKLCINIEIGKRFFVNRLYFEGNDITKDSVLRREMSQMEGSVFSIDFINQGKDRLKRLGYFNDVEVQVRYIPELLDQIDVIYKVKEKNTGNMNLNVGIGTTSGVNFQCSIQDDNLIGTGNTVSLSCIKNDYQLYNEFLFNNSYSFINGISLGFKVFYSKFNASNADLAPYNLKSCGISSTFAFPLSKNSKFHYGLDYTCNNLLDVTPQVAIWRYFASKNIFPKIFVNNIVSNDFKFIANDLFVNIGYIFDSLDHMYFPTHGIYSSLSSKITIPGSYNKYYQIVFDISRYFRLYKDTDWILKGRLRLGFLGGLFGQEPPFYDNFFSSGSNSIRGFQSNNIGPKAVYYKCQFYDLNYDTCVLEKSSDAVGGNGMGVVKTELIIPTFLNYQYSNTMRLFLFIDAGTVWDSYWKYMPGYCKRYVTNYGNPGNIRVSSGIALKWLSPLGPIEFSYAYFLKKYAEDKLEQFQFNVGKTW